MTIVDPVLPDLQDLFETLVAQDWSLTKGLPERRWAQFGIPVVTCEELAIGLLTLREEELVAGTPSCGVVSVADMLVVIGRECGSESSDDGSTVIEWAERNAAWMDADTVVLRSWIQTLEISPASSPSFGYAVEGGIAYTTVNLSVRMGW